MNLDAFRSFLMDYHIASENLIQTLKIKEKTPKHSSKTPRNRTDSDRREFTLMDGDELFCEYSTPPPNDPGIISYSYENMATLALALD